MGENIFLTGATGFLGTEILKDLMTETDKTVYVLIRAKNSDEASIRLSRLYWDMEILHKNLGKRIIPIVGDISQKNLGIENFIIIKNVSYIIHSAAEVSIKKSDDELWNINVKGTENVLEFAKELSEIQPIKRFSHISTAYVAGQRTGEVFEDELVDKGFCTMYEKTKFEAEKLLKNYEKVFPISVFRPGQIVGNSKTGMITSFNTLYYPLKLFLYGKLKIIPADGKLKLNMVPVDFVSQAVIRGTFLKDNKNKTYHLTAPIDNEPTVKELIQFVVKWAEEELKLKLKMPVFINIPFMGKLGVLYNFKIKDKFFKGKNIITNLMSLAPYFNEKRKYNDKNIRELMGDNYYDWKNYIIPLLRYAVYMGFLDKTDRNVFDQLMVRLSSKRNKINYHDICNEGIKSISAKKMAEDIKKASFALKRIGVQQGDRVGIVGLNSSRYFTLDAAVGINGSVSVPLYYTSPIAEIASLIKISGAKVLFVGDIKILKSLNKEFESIKIVSFCTDKFESDILDILSWEEFMLCGESVSDKTYLDFGSNATIRYTSGTTGNPKGVVFNHYNLKWMAQSLVSVLPLKQRTEDMRILSFLPMNHVVEGILANYSAYYNLCNLDVYFLENFHDLQNALPKVKPTIFFSVPRFYEKLWENLMKNNLGKKYYNMENGIVKRSIAVLLKYVLLKKAGLNKCKMFIAGSAPISTELIEGFRGLGIEIYNAYGLTEAPLVSINTYKKNVIGSVGMPLHDTLIKIADDGEVLVKGAQLTTGIYNENSEEYFEDGFLKTGDLGYLDEFGSLFLNGRKKEVIVTSYGKNIFPIKIETKLRMIDKIAEAIVVGDSKPYCIAVLWIDKAHEKTFNKEEIDFQIETINQTLSNPEKVKKWIILNNNLSIKEGDLTANLKIKRNKIVEKYEEIIDLAYNEDFISHESITHFGKISVE